MSKKKPGKTRYFVGGTEVDKERMIQREDEREKFDFEKDTGNPRRARKSDTTYREIESKSKSKYKKLKKKRADSPMSAKAKYKSSTKNLLKELKGVKGEDPKAEERKATAYLEEYKRNKAREKKWPSPRGR